MVVLAYVYYFLVVASNRKKFRCKFESGHMVESLGAWYDVILVFSGYFHSNATFWCFPNFLDLMGLYLWCIRLDCTNFHFNIFLFLGVTADFSFGWIFLLDFTGFTY